MDEVKGSTKKSSHLPIVLLTVVAAIVSIVAIIVTATKGLPAGLKVEEGVVQVDQLEVGKVSYTGKDGKAGRVLTYTSANGVEFQDLPSYVAGVVPGSGTGSAGSVPLKGGTAGHLVRYQEGGSLGEAQVSVNSDGDVIFQGSKYKKEGLFLKTKVDGSIEAVSLPTTNVVAGDTNLTLKGTTKIVQLEVDDLYTSHKSAVLLTMISEGPTLQAPTYDHYPAATNLLNPNFVVGIPSQTRKANYLIKGHILTYKFAGWAFPFNQGTLMFNVPGLGVHVGFETTWLLETPENAGVAWCFDMTITVVEPLKSFLVSAIWSVGAQSGCVVKKVKDQTNMLKTTDVNFSPHAFWTGKGGTWIVANQGYVELRGVMSNYKED